MRTVPFLAGPLLVLALCSPLAAQQEPVVSPAEMDAALRVHAERAEGDRTVVDRVLARADVEAAARAAGVGGALDDARASTGQLQGERLSRAASLARTLEVQLAGGQTFVFSATTIIIILLIVIVVVLIAD